MLNLCATQTNKKGLKVTLLTLNLLTKAYATVHIPNQCGTVCRWDEINKTEQLETLGAGAP